MEHTAPPDMLQIKDETRPSDSPGFSDQDVKRPIRRVRSPSRPRAWLSHSYKPKFAGKFFLRDDHSAHKSGFNSHRYPHSKFHFHGRDHYLRKGLAAPQKDREREERYDQRKSGGETLPTEQNNSRRAFLPRSTSSRDKDKQFVSRSDKSQSRESDHRGSRSSERERNRDEEPPSIASQARDRAIQKKRREIDEVYYQECEMFGFVVKMLIAKDPSLEGPIQASLQQNLRDIGARCVEAMERFIVEYDSKEPPQ